MIVMELFSIEYYKKEQFYLLQEDWKRLEIGSDMTYYQSYDWYEMLNEHYVPDDTSDYISIYAVLKKDNVVIMIAPFWIVKHTFNWVNKKGIYLLGHEGWTDYVNIIYYNFDSEGLSFLLTDVSCKYNVRKFRFDKMKQDVQSFRYLLTLRNVKKNWTGICVALSLPSTNDDYKKLLSKNARQNIRTAYNRLAKDGIDIRIKFDDQDVNRDICREIREQRFIKKFQKESGLRAFKHKWMYRHTFHFSSYLPFYGYDKGHFLTVCHGEELCSFFYYLRDDVHREIVVQAAGVNMKYAKYSPGMISLNAFINDLIEQGKINTVDFTAGDEPYKYAVGGMEHYMESITLHF